MGAKLLVVLVYLAGMLVLGALARRKTGGAQEFFLAGRSLRTFVLLGTMAATNFSAFTVVGFSGAGYRMGFAFYPVMAYGTGLMALTFILIGIPAFRIGRELGLITPAELIEARFGSRRLGVTFAVVQSVFTLPYLALQPLAAGYVLESLLGVPHALGAAVVTAVIVCYVLAGGMRSVAWTDVVQGFVMLAALAAGLAVVVDALGGWSAATTRLAAASPEHLTRPGAGGGLPVGIWVSYMALWFMADPMLPQLFQRFYAARDERSIVRTAALYPVVTTVIFFLPVAIGAFGRVLIPGLEGQKADTVFPLLMERFGGPWLAGLAAAGVLAAIMSTMDSQLLTLASIVERDFLRRQGRRSAAGRRSATASARPPAARASPSPCSPSPGARWRSGRRPRCSRSRPRPSRASPCSSRRSSRRSTGGGPPRRARCSRSSWGRPWWSRITSGCCPTWGCSRRSPRRPRRPSRSCLPGLRRRRAPRSRRCSRPTRGSGWGGGGPSPGRSSSARFGVLSTDWWRFDGRSPAMVAGLPDWVIYFIVLGFALAVALALFGRDATRVGNRARRARRARLRRGARRPC